MKYLITRFRRIKLKRPNNERKLNNLITNMIDKSKPKNAVFNYLKKKLTRKLKNFTKKTRFLKIKE